MSKNQRFNNSHADAKDINVDVEAAAAPSVLDGIFAIKVEQRTEELFFGSFFSSSVGNMFSLNSRLYWQELNATARHGGGHSRLIWPGLLPATWHKWLPKVKLAFFTYDRPEFLDGSTASS